MKKFNTRNILACVQRLTMWVLGIAVVCQLAACSAIKMTYTNADTLGYWWLDAYIDMDAGQKTWARGEIAQYLRWHRQTQLPDYADLLRMGQARVTGNASARQLEADFAEVRRRAETAINHALPQLAELALTLKPEQLAHLERKFAKNNEDYRRKYLRGDADKRQTDRYKRVLRRAEYWFGHFSREQRDAIRRASDARPLDHELWAGQRVERQRRLLAVLHKVQRERPPRDEVQAMLAQLSHSLFEPPAAPGQRAFFDAYAAGTAAMTESIIRLATPAQKAHAVAKFQQLIADCAELQASGTK